MCVAIYKPAGKTITRKELEACFDSNKDGAGLVYFDGTRAHLRKGFFDRKQWVRACLAIPTDAPAILHARITTHGETSAKNCHPFFVSANPLNLEAANITIKGGYVAAHNGVISGMKPKNGVDKSHSDTMQFIAQLLAPLSKTMNLLDGAGRAIVDKLTEGSRFAIMRADTGEVALFGDWRRDEKSGVYYSNNYWKWHTTSHTTPSNQYDGGYYGGYGQNGLGYWKTDDKGVSRWISARDYDNYD